MSARQRAEDRRRCALRVPVVKIVSAFMWSGPGEPVTPAFVTDTGELLLFRGVLNEALLVRRFTITDETTKQPAIPPFKTLSPGDKIEVLYVLSGDRRHVWNEHVVEYVGATTFTYREREKQGTLGYADEGKHWRRV